MASATILADGGYITGTYSVTIDGVAYTIDTSSHDLPVSEAIASAADGTFKGGASVKLQEKIAVKIKGITGTAPPSQLVKFALAVDGYASKNWKVTNLKIDSSNSGAVITEYSADITEYKSA